mmetsp:Transcript_80858/g.240972  ORF Transcript_80858/g.240972 Transcript_80858/m.240972 type:complete len:255 (-) Transcript_80858:128-892(-)
MSRSPFAHSAPRNCSFRLLRLSRSWLRPTKKAPCRGRGSEGESSPASAPSPSAGGARLPNSTTRGSAPSRGGPAAAWTRAMRIPSAVFRKLSLGHTSGAKWALRLRPRKDSSRGASPAHRAWTSGTEAPSSCALVWMFFVTMAPAAAALADGSSTTCLGAIRSTKVLRSCGSSELSGRKRTRHATRMVRSRTSKCMGSRKWTLRLSLQSEMESRADSGTSSSILTASSLTWSTSLPSTPPPGPLPALHLLPSWS